MKEENEDTEIPFALPRKANDCITDPAGFRPPERLFDEFWRECERLKYSVSNILSTELGLINSSAFSSVLSGSEIK